MAQRKDLSPFVYWAQTETSLSIRIDLRNVQDSHYRLLDREVQFTITKTNSDWWPRLLLETDKPAWLKVDFDKLRTEDDDEEEDNTEDTREENMFNEMIQDMHKRKRKKLKKAEEFRKMYLFMYNMFQFVGYLYIFIVMSIRYAKDGPASMETTYGAVGKVFKFCMLMQLLEIIHPLLGYTAGTVIVPIVQIFGRIIVIFIMIDSEPRMHAKPVVFYLFFTYTLSELVRYPYYMLRVYRVNIGFITWIRYTMWIILYPFGFLCEGVIILRDIPYFEETERFSVALPNCFNFSFHFPTIMRIYLLTLFFPVMYFMMSHMYRKRVKIVGGRRKKYA